MQCKDLIVCQLSSIMDMCTTHKYNPKISTMYISVTQHQAITWTPAYHFDIQLIPSPSHNMLFYFSSFLAIYF